MRKTVSLLMSFAFFVQSTSILSAVEPATVESVRVSAESVYIKTSKPVDYKAFMLSKPPKLVLDLKNARLKTLQEIPVGGTFLRKVRTGQYQREPVSISRIVMELSQKAAYDILEKSGELVVIIGGKLFSGKKDSFKSAPKDEEKKELVKTIVPRVYPGAGESEAADISVNVPAENRPGDGASEDISYSNDIMENLPKEKISIDYSEADTKEVLKMMADRAGINIVFGDDISGNVTIKLDEVPLEEAFKTILNTKGLATQQLGDKILRIASPRTLEREQEKSIPQTKVFFLNYAVASEVSGQIMSVAGAKGRKAVVTVDERNNALIVTDTPIGLGEMERLVKSLDRAPKQVMIEAKLVEVALNNDFNLGIQWSGYGEKDGTYFGAGDEDSALKSGGSGLVYKTDGSGTSLPLGSKSSGFGVNLPANIIYGSFRLGKIASNYMFDAILTAAAGKGKAKVLSDPKVATLNNKEATINITTQIPYTETETTQSDPPVSTTKVTYITTGIILKVTPTITSDNRVSLKINPEVSQVSPTVKAAAGGAPGIDTRTADTNVIVNDGETVVIGGLIHDYQSEGEFKVPLLGDLPLLGWLFKKKTSTRERRELMIFVTPKVVR